MKAGQKPGYPRCKGYRRYDRFNYPQSGFVLLDNNRLSLSKIGEIKIVLHRPLEGRCKTLTVQRNAVGQWYACFSIEVDPQPPMDIEKAVGVDEGLESFATFSNGEKVSNPRFFRQEEQELASAQRKLSKAEKGTPERAKRRKVVAHIYQRVANRHKDFAHKLSRQLVNEYGRIAFEKLNTNGMLKNHCLAKSIADAAWNQWIQLTTYKAEEAGRVVVRVNPSNTSKMCSRCGVWVEKPLLVRVHKCPVCGLEMDRDENAAMNILALGRESLRLTGTARQRMCTPRSRLV